MDDAAGLCSERCCIYTVFFVVKVSPGIRVTPQ
jgi:hypothetical protein